MESSHRLCPVCGKHAHVFRLNDARENMLFQHLLGKPEENPVAAMEGYWCVGCLTPYLVVWPEVADINEALRMAGFPPKGGVL